MTKVCWRQWKPSYAHGFAMQAILAVIAGVLGLLAAWQTGDWRWAVEPCSSSDWPYTLLGIMPSTTKLNAIASASRPGIAQPDRDWWAAARGADRFGNCGDARLSGGRSLNARAAGAGFGALQFQVAIGCGAAFSERHR